MPKVDRFLIAPLVEGLESDVEPWLLPDKAFAMLNNAYIYRGRVKKRFGSELMTGTAPSVAYEQLSSRLRIKVGTTHAVTGNVAGTAPGVRWDVGQLFSIGTEIYTVYQTGVAVDMLRTSVTATTYTYDTTNGAFVINGSANLNTDCYFYPADPVMALLSYEVAAINSEEIVAFDRQFAYQYLATGWDRLGVAPGIWTSSDSQFFWGTNCRSTNAYDYTLYVTNNNTTDKIKFWNGATWTTFNPAVNVGGTDKIEACLIIVWFHNRLLLLNTTETHAAATNTYVNRCRFSKDGDPRDADSFLQNPETIGLGGWFDAPTREAIISAKILRDRLIVFFERSTREIVYTGNKIRPFLWQTIDAELGVESTFSTVLFDRYVLGVGNVGIHACNGATVERIDSKIPDEVYRFHNADAGLERTQGIRDYKQEMVYWALPNLDATATFPNKVLVYNYKTNTWAFNDDSITCFGYYQSAADETWEMITETWEETTRTWDGPEVQSLFRNVVAGNQEGFVFKIIENSRNAPSLQITQLAMLTGVVTVTAYNHNLSSGDFVAVEHVQGTTGWTYTIYQVITVPDDDNFTINDVNVTGAYTGGGVITRVSRIDIRTKEYNFYQKQGLNLFIPKIDFYVKRTDNGEVCVDYLVSSSQRSMVEDGYVSDSLFGDGILITRPYPAIAPSTDLPIPLEASQTRFWHAFYPQAEGETIQLRLYLNDSQMLDSAIAWSDFELNAFCIYAESVHRF